MEQGSSSMTVRTWAAAGSSLSLRFPSCAVRSVIAPPAKAPARASRPHAGALNWRLMAFVTGSHWLAGLAAGSRALPVLAHCSPVHGARPASNGLSGQRDAELVAASEREPPDHTHYSRCL